MNFLRKLFPITQKKNVATTKENNDMAKETYIKSHSEVASNINEPENTVNNNEHTFIDSDSSFRNSDDSNKIFHTLENVTPIKIILNDDTYKNPKENEINDVTELFVGDDITSKENSEFVENVIQNSPLFHHLTDDLKQMQASYVTNSNFNYYNSEDSLHKKPNDETEQNLKEFEDVLENFDRIVPVSDLDIECIDLDEIEDLFNELDTENEEPVSENNHKSLNSIKLNDIKNNNVTDYEVQPNANENVDIISISSETDDEIILNNETRDPQYINPECETLDSDDGYNSSDFEFISETEAKMDGFIINFRRENNGNLSHEDSETSCYFGRTDEENCHNKEFSDPGEGTSKQNRQRNEFEDRSYRNDHEIPMGDDYLGLFQGIYQPLIPLSEIFFLENKSIRTSAMNSQYEGMGFDKQLAMRRHQPDSSEEEFEDEAKEVAKQILSTYPRENRKRRRRHL